MDKELIKEVVAEMIKSNEIRIALNNETGEQIITLICDEYVDEDRIYGVSACNVHDNDDWGFKKEELFQEQKVEVQKVEKEVKTKKQFGMTLNYKSPEECTSLEELQELGKSLGYKPGWSFIKAKQLGIN